MTKEKPRTLPDVRRRVQTHPVGESKTEQHHRAECDINSIVSKCQKTGYLPPARGLPHYGDFSQIGSYREALDSVKAAEQAFMMLPSSVRKHFRNDPGELLAFLGDDRNKEEAIKLGLIEPPEPQAPQPVDQRPEKGPESPSKAEKPADT